MAISQSTSMAESVAIVIFWLLSGVSIVCCDFCWSFLRTYLCYSPTRDACLSRESTMMMTSPEAIEDDVIAVWSAPRGSFKLRTRPFIFIGALIIVNQPYRLGYHTLETVPSNENSQELSAFLAYRGKYARISNDGYSQMGQNTLTRTYRPR